MKLYSCEEACGATPFNPQWCVPPRSHPLLSVRTALL